MPLMEKAFGAIAQLVEQRTENPCVPSSILGGTTEKTVYGPFFFVPQRFLTRVLSPKGHDYCLGKFLRRFALSIIA